MKVTINIARDNATQNISDGQQQVNHYPAQNTRQSLPLCDRCGHPIDGRVYRNALGDQLHDGCYRRPITDRVRRPLPIEQGDIIDNDTGEIFDAQRVGMLCESDDYRHVKPLRADLHTHAPEPVETDYHQRVYIQGR